MRGVSLAEEYVAGTKNPNTRSKPGREDAAQNSGFALTMPPRKWLLIAAMLVFACTFVAFIPALGNQFVDWDDPDNFLRNPHFRGLGPSNIAWMFSTFHMGHYQPLTWLTLGVDATIGRLAFGNDLDPRPYHFTNVLLHAINASLLLLVGLRLFRSCQKFEVGGHNSVVALLIGGTVAALFFGVHPLRVESVAWATERRDLLSAFFLLLAVLAYLHAQEPDQPLRLRWMVLTLIAFIFSLLSKVIGVTLPVVLLILDWYPLRRLNASPLKWAQPPSRRVLLEKIPFFALSLVFALIATIGQASNQWLMTTRMHSLGARIMQSFYGLEFYAWKTLTPTDLLPLYQMQLPLDYSGSRYIIAAVVVIAAVIVCFLLRNRAPWMLAASAAYCIMLLPVLGLIQNGSQIVADRYSYLSCMPWAVLIGALVIRAQQSAVLLIRSVTIAAATCVLILLGMLTWRQCFVWRTTESLWTHTYFGDPEGLFAKNGYGFVLLQKGDYQPAIALFRDVLSVTPGNDKARINLWDALEKTGDEATLIAELREGMRFPAVADLAHNRLGKAHYRLGNKLLKEERFEEAVAEYRASIDVQPTAMAHSDLGFVLQNLGQPDQAAQQYSLAIAVDPNLYQPRLNLALLLKDDGRTAEAIEQFREVLRIKPDHAVAAANLRQLTGDVP